MAFDIIHISDLFATVVDRMRPTGVVTTWSQVGATSSYKIKTPVVYTANEYNLAVDNFVDLYDVSSVLVGSYIVTAINTTTNEITVTVVTAPTGTPATWKSQAPYYEHGHILEIANTLLQKNDDGTLKEQKYPLVILARDFKQGAGNTNQMHSNPTVNVFIVALTEPTLKAAERKATTFALVLLPLYHKLLYEIHYSRKFRTTDWTEIPHTMYERYYWGKEGVNSNTKEILGDWLDAIEIQSIELQAKKSSPQLTGVLIKLK